MISVVICSHNGSARIGATLEALRNQSVLEDAQDPSKRAPTKRRIGEGIFEVIVVDDGSSDEVEKIAKLAGAFTIRLETNQGLSAARNAGVAQARGDYIAFCDDDCRPGTNWIRQLEDAWGAAGDDIHGIGGVVTASEVGSLGGAYGEAVNALNPLPHPTNKLSTKIGRYLRGPTRWRDPVRVGSLVGANMSFRRKSLVSTGGFDPQIRFGGDEEHVCAELRKRYGENSLLVIPEIVMAHEYHPSYKDALRRARAYGKGAGRRWVRQGGQPILLPGPVMFVGSIILAGALGSLLGSTAALGAAAAAWLGTPWLVAGWVGRESRGWPYWAGPYMRITEETAGLFGFIQGWWGERSAASTKKTGNGAP